MTISHPTTPSKSGPRRANTLPSACMLDEYRIDSILGAGGFGVTYKALDTHLETWVAIKEYFPVEWSFRDADGITVRPNTQGETSGTDGQVSDYLWGLERFLDEARVLARVQHPYVVRVKRYFRAHGTAYIVMDYEEGEPLSAVLRDGEVLAEDEVRGLLEDVLPALQAVHEQGYLHRDIKPSNLYVRSNDQRVLLIDFGAAREAVGRHSKSVTSLVTPGYSPPEQYTTRTDRYGVWTDVYALGAVLYRCITGHTPTEAAERLLDDRMQPAVEAGAGRYSTNLLEVIDQALAVRPEQRFLTVADMQNALAGPQEEDSHQTVIMMPTRKGRPAMPSAAGQLTRPPTGGQPTLPEPPAAGEESIVEHHPDWLDITHIPASTSPDQSPTSPVLPPKGAAPSRRWPLPALLAGGGVALMASAAMIVWLGASGPVSEEKPQTEQKPAPRYSRDASGGLVSNRPAEPVAAPAPVAAPVVATPVPAESPGGAAPAAAPVVAVPTPGTDQTLEPVAAEARQPARPTVPVEQPTAEGSELKAVAPAGASGVLPVPGVAPATRVEPPTDESATLLRKPSAASKTQVRDAAPSPKKPERQKTARKRQESSNAALPAHPVPAQPAPVQPKRDNLWDAPADTGFNQK